MKPKQPYPEWVRTVVLAIALSFVFYLGYQAAAFDHMMTGKFKGNPFNPRIPTSDINWLEDTSAPACSQRE